MFDEERYFTAGKEATFRPRYRFGLHLRRRLAGPTPPAERRCRMRLAINGSPFEVDSREARTEVRVRGNRCPGHLRQYGRWAGRAGVRRWPSSWTATGKCVPCTGFRRAHPVELGTLRRASYRRAETRKPCHRGECLSALVTGTRDYVPSTVFGVVSGFRRRRFGAGHGCL